jgi:hypothetical protein
MPTKHLCSDQLAPDTREKIRPMAAAYQTNATDVVESAIRYFYALCEADGKVPPFTTTPTQPTLPYAAPKGR